MGGDTGGICLFELKCVMGFKNTGFDKLNHLFIYLFFVYFSCVNIIAKLKQYVKMQSLVSVYHALVHPYLNYGCILWGNNYEAPVSQLVKLQNEASRSYYASLCKPQPN